MHRSWLSGASDEEGSASEGRVPSPPASDTESGSLLDTVMLAEWEDRAEQGLFRYDVTACPTKVVPGAYGFVAQCNEGRGSKKRPTEFRVDKVRCASPYSCFLPSTIPILQALSPYEICNVQEHVMKECNAYVQDGSLWLIRQYPASLVDIHNGLEHM